MIMEELIAFRLDICVISDTRTPKIDILGAQESWSKLTGGDSLWTPYVGIACSSKYNLHLLNTYLNGRVMEIEFYYKLNKQ